MVTGVAGFHGQVVTSRVMVEPRQGNDCATILNQLMAGKIARVQQPRASLVTLKSAQASVILDTEHH